MTYDGAFKHWDLGDIVGCHGHAVPHAHRRADGEVRRAAPAVKALRPLPEKFHGLADGNPLSLPLPRPDHQRVARNTFIARSRMMSACAQ
jgi:lysyl-tRNA synthetase class 2